MSLVVVTAVLIRIGLAQPPLLHSESDPEKYMPL